MNNTCKMDAALLAVAAEYSRGNGPSEKYSKEIESFKKITKRRPNAFRTFGLVK